MTNFLLIYEESGYLFNDATKRLEWFEIDKILISFTYGTVKYIGDWGGNRVDNMLEGKQLYSSEECFKKGNGIPKRKISIYDTFRSLYGFSPINNYVWEYKNGKAVREKLESFNIVLNRKGEFSCSKKYYESKEDVYRFNDLTVVDKNGDVRLVKSPKSKLILTNDQLSVVERMRDIIDDMVKLKMIMYIDQGYNLCFLPEDKIESLTMDEVDGSVDTTDIVTSIKSKNVVEFYVENPFIKIKDE